MKFGLDQKFELKKTEFTAKFGLWVLKKLPQILSMYMAWMKFSRKMKDI